MTGRALMASTSLQTRGGISSYVRMLRDTPLWARWRVVHVATHRDGSTAAKIATFAGALPRFAAELVLRRPDVVHLHMSSYGSFVRKAALFWMARALRVPTVVHVHGSEFATFHDRLPAPLRAVVRATLEQAAVVIALGGRWRERLLAIAPRASVVTVPNAVRVPPARAGGRTGAPHAVFLGEIGERKGTFALLEAWAKLKAESPRPESPRPESPDAGSPPAEDGGIGGARLTVAGDRDVERARAAVAGYGLDDSVTVRAWMSPDEVQALLADADVFVLPSLSEGQPMAILEAMAHGLCVVASDVGGIPEMIEDGRSGRLVPPGDVGALEAALREVLGDADRRRGLGAGARERALAEFDIDVVWRRVEELYLGAVAR